MDPQPIGDWYRGRTVVVTGGFGYLASGLCERLERAGARLRRTSRRAREGAWVGDLGDASFVASLVAGADVVFHLAAQTSVGVSHDHPFADLAANVGSTLALLEACARGERAPHFVYSGTATAIGLTTTVPSGSDAPDRPITVYDANKLAAEQLVGVYAAAGRVPGVTLRIANVYGPGAAKSAPDRGVTNKLVGRALAGHDLTYYGDGMLQRDYVYVDDLLDAFFRAGVRVDRATRRAYLVAGGKGYTFREVFACIADVVAELGRPRVAVLAAPWPAGSHPIDKRSFVGDIAPTEEWLEWRPTTSLREGLRRTATSLANGEAP